MLTGLERLVQFTDDNGVGVPQCGGSHAYAVFTVDVETYVIFFII